jgi:HAD superfamily hydrolase (TIGR01509 family)
MIKSVIFDIDGVLLDSFEANLKFFQDLMTAFGYPAPTRETYPAAFHLTMLNAIKKLTESTNEDEINTIWTAAKNREIPYAVGLLKTPKNTEAVLQKLSAEHALGIVTSRIKETVFESPKMSALRHFFKVVISANDTEVHKPNPEPLLLCAKKLNVAPQECVYIGDVSNDVTAAHAAGMRVIIYSNQAIPAADRWTNSFQEIPNLVSSFS